MSRRTLTRAPNPHQAPPLSAATRRDLFGTMGALLLLTAAEAGPAKAAELDGELLACCSDAFRLEKEAETLIAGVPNTSDPIWDQYESQVDEYCALFERAAEISARTPEGMQAKARIILSRRYTDDGLALEIAASLARDVLGRAGA